MLKKFVLINSNQCSQFGHFDSKTVKHYFVDFDKIGEAAFPYMIRRMVHPVNDELIYLEHVNM